jgi:hypothetical protein
MSEVSDLAPLKGMKLTTLLVEKTRVTDLKPICNMPLEVLAVRGAPVEPMELQKTCAKLAMLKHLLIDFEPARDTELLRSIQTLEMVNWQPAATFIGMKNE